MPPKRELHGAPRPGMWLIAMLGKRFVSAHLQDSQGLRARRFAVASTAQGFTTTFPKPPLRRLFYECRPNWVIAGRLQIHVKAIHRMPSSDVSTGLDPGWVFEP